VVAAGAGRDPAGDRLDLCHAALRRVTRVVHAAGLAASPRLTVAQLDQHDLRLREGVPRDRKRVPDRPALDARDDVHSQRFSGISAPLWYIARPVSFLRREAVFRMQYEKEAGGLAADRRTTR